MNELLPALNALLNATSATLLVAGYRAIRRDRRERHKRLMIGALCASALFLVSYLTYHALYGSKRYSGEGASRAIYLAILFTHSLLAAVNVPLVVVTVIRAARGQFERHRRIARWTLGVWLYVSVTGVVVYLMLYRF